MVQLIELLAPLITLLGLLLTTLLVIHQITLQRRLSYITSVMKDREVFYWYKIFLKDLRFIHEVLSVFPEVRIDEVTVARALADDTTRLKLEYLTTYMREVLNVNERLKAKYPQMAQRTAKYFEPAEVFVPDYFASIRLFVLSIMKSLSFHPARPWFIALFSPARKRRDAIARMISDYKLLFHPLHVLDVEGEVRDFVLGVW